MNRLTLLILILIFSISLSANDASFAMSGNQLVPVIETDISVQKEILTISKRSANLIEVSVYYEFYNPKEAKTLTVGFEAPAHDRYELGNRDVVYNNKHPYIKDFKVLMNNTSLPYKVALVPDSLYLQNGKIRELSSAEIKKVEDTGFDSDLDICFTYAYHFNAHFKKGLNIIKHTYTFHVSPSIANNYDFNYILTAASRWGNKQIDDFTLIVDMGELEDIYLYNNAFKGNGKWTLKGSGKAILKDAPSPFYRSEEKEETGLSRFIIRKGLVEYKALNFKPKGELYIFSPGFAAYQHELFDCEDDNSLSFSPLYVSKYEKAANDLSKRILRNLPFARRGYIFTTPEIQAYYSKQEWYMPDANYTSSLESLTPDEREWVQRWSK